jgi:hypothetical protein
LSRSSFQQVQPKTLLLLGKRLVGGLKGDRLKSNAVSGAQLRGLGQIGRNEHSNLWIAANGLSIRH